MAKSNYCIIHTACCLLKFLHLRKLPTSHKRLYQSLSLNFHFPKDFFFHVMGTFIWKKLRYIFPSTRPKGYFSPQKLENGMKVNTISFLNSFTFEVIFETALILYWIESINLWKVPPPQILTYERAGLWRGPFCLAFLTYCSSIEFWKDKLTLWSYGFTTPRPPTIGVCQKLNVAFWAFGLKPPTDR